jgi:hypothetical protein
VFGPELAMLSRPRLSCLSAPRTEHSSLNGLPQIDSPPLPVPVAVMTHFNHSPTQRGHERSPPCSINPGTRRWKMVSSYLRFLASERKL